ncbi:MAG: hypothetical protein ICV70_05295 [Jiangellaceae bacterium]|nr:hypothetical protein [Jiangellaceae bacterium]
MTRVVSAVTALPPHRHHKSATTTGGSDILGRSGQKLAAMQRFQAASGVRTRHLVLPVERMGGSAAFGKRTMRGPGFCCKLVPLRWPESKAA